eukprot:364341-Chlamydomonas_euryale.AAC.9
MAPVHGVPDMALTQTCHESLPTEHVCADKLERGRESAGRRRGREPEGRKEKRKHFWGPGRRARRAKPRPHFCAAAALFPTPTRNVGMVGSFTLNIMKPPWRSRPTAA